MEAFQKSCDISWADRLLECMFVIHDKTSDEWRSENPRKRGPSKACVGWPDFSASRGGCDFPCHLAAVLESLERPSKADEIRVVAAQMDVEVPSELLLVADLVLSLGLKPFKLQETMC